MGNVKVIEATRGKTVGMTGITPSILRVGIYARVSTDSEEQESSYHSQIETYTKRVNNDPNQELVNVYADKGISGTSAARRPEFQRLLADCRAGKIDLVLTKSISRFARNQKECINIVDDLLEYGVDVYFEKENIHSKDKSQGLAALIFTIVAQFAQQESESISQNVKMGMNAKMQRGELVGGNGKILGYDYTDGTYTINEEEAETVRRIFDLYLSGNGYTKIANTLENEERKTGRGTMLWHFTSVQCIILNEKYYGAVLSQKTVVSDFMKHKRIQNQGQQQKYLTDDHHPAIISKDTFDLAQQERERRALCAAGINPDRSKYTVRYAFSEHLYCENCGSTLKRTWRTNGIVWMCRHKIHGEQVCNASGVHNAVMEQCFIEIYNKVTSDNQTFFEHFTRSVMNQTMKHEKKSDTSMLNNQIKEAEDQVDELVMMKARREIDGDFYSRNYQALKEKLLVLQEKRAACADRQLSALNQKAKLEQIKSVIFSHETPITTFDGDLFTAIVETVVVHSPFDLTFNLFGGIEYRIDGTQYKPKDRRGRPPKKK